MEKMFIRGRELWITATWLWKRLLVGREEDATNGLFASTSANLRGCAFDRAAVPSGPFALIRTWL